MPVLFLLFVVLPAVELSLLIEIGSRIGTVETLLLIVVTGMVGASLARHQGLQVLRSVEIETAQGRLPGEALADGMIILLAAALLVTPGVLTDIAGFLCLVPVTRRVFRSLLWRWFEQRVQKGRANMTVHFGGFGEPPDGDVVDVTPERYPPDRTRLPPDQS